VIDKIIVCRLRIGWCGEVYSVGFARLFDGSVIARKADHAGVEICETHSQQGPSKYYRQSHAPVIYFRTCSTESLAGSTLTKTGITSSFPNRSTALPILSSSSGHISGQWVNPKYMSVHLPRRSLSVKGWFWEVVRRKGPPIEGLPTDLDWSSSPAVRVRCLSHVRGKGRLTSAFLDFDLFRFEIEVEAYACEYE
jgi:hypothetical protein